MDLVSWGIGSDFPAKDVKIFVLNSLLREFEFLISQAKQQLLYSNGITQPLLKLLDQCPVVSLSLSRLLHTLCVLMCRDPLLLEFTKQVSRDVTRNEYLIFSNLVPLLHLQGPVGNHARDALLLILALSDRDPEVAAYLTSQSDICPVLATGLSAHYSCLPKRLVLNGSDGYPSGGDRGRSTETLRVHGAGWHRITKPEWSACEPLVQFLQTLDFCNLAIRISHPSVRKDLLFYIYSGFLMSVLRSALNQKTVDEVTAAEAYLELFLRRLTEPALIGLFLRFIVASDQDSSSVLSSLITRINASSTDQTDETRRLGLVTLSLFRTILNLNCEDVMFLVVFQYINGLDFAPKRVVSGCLTSCSGKDNSKYISDPDNDYWLASAQRFLRLSAWCTRFAGAGDTNSQSEDNSTQYPPPNRLATCLLDSHRLIKSRTSSTGVWSADYSVVTSPHPNHTNDPPNAPLHSTPIRTLMTSSLCNKVQTDRQPESSLIDRYKSESNIYQL
uniref:Lysosomal trafficking regulator lyst n=1 Tax=Mesocestoides corti TaxID=53468 RepID=A0A5K3ESL5_MESCO